MKRKNYHFLFFLFFVSWSLCWGQTSREYEVTAPGALESLVSSEKNTITDLTLTGTLNAADFATIRSMAALQNLNLERANLLDNTLPGNAFFKKELKEIILPYSLERIGNTAFAGAILEELDFSKTPNLVTIGADVFDGLTIKTGNELNFKTNSKLVNFNTYNNVPTFTGFKGKVILPLNLKKIPALTFYKFEGSIEMPPALEEIGNTAFAGAILEELDFSKTPNLVTIGADVFDGLTIKTGNELNFKTNSKLVNFNTYNNVPTFTGFKGKVILPLNLKKIPALTFYKFEGSIELPPALEEIGNTAFAGAILEELDFSKTPNLVTIGADVFDGLTIKTGNELKFTTNSKLVNFNIVNNITPFTGFNGRVILPDSLKRIPDRTFWNFTGSIELPTSLEEIGKWVFSGAEIEELDFSKSPNLKTLDGAAFNNLTITSGNELNFKSNSNLINILTVSQAYPSAVWSPFTGFNGRVILPDSLKRIPDRTFWNFTGSIELPTSLEEIGTWVFSGSTLKELFLPASVKLIANNAFNEMKLLERLSICAITPPTLGANVFSGVPVSNVELAVPKNTISSYKKANQWNQFTQINESNICEAAPYNPFELQVYAPNSYIFDIEQAKSNNYGGLAIPVTKAYAMWENNEYLDHKSIPSGKLSSSVYWEDVEGLIRSTEIDQNGSNSQIKVQINQAKGKGNAVIAFHVGSTGDPKKDPIYWSWHVWVTDDPTQGVTYNNNPSGYGMINTFMDRNLGALSSKFWGDDWHRSGGLLYQWGRKDPFPALAYLDGSTPIINSLPYGKFSNKDVLTNRVPLSEQRSSDFTKDNIQKSINEPFKIIKFNIKDFATNQARINASWFTNDLYGYEVSHGKSYDLWGNNTEGYKYAGQVFEQKQKSPFDPCPAGWRVPSGGMTAGTWWTSSPWGKRLFNGFTSEYELTKHSEQFKGVKAYPALGFDFTNAENYNIGIYPSTGHYTMEPDSQSGNVRILFQDEGAQSFLWTGTMGCNNCTTNHVQVFRLIQDVQQRTDTNSQNWDGLYLIDNYNFTSGHTSALNGVRCVKESLPKMEWKTLYLPNDKVEFKDGLENPNSYMLVKKADYQEISIPVNKAFAIYNQFLSNREMPNGKLSVNIYWTDNMQLVGESSLLGSDQNALIKVKISPNQSGNAVISLHNGDQGNSNDPVLWSWHLWVPNSDPTEKTFTHTTLEKYSKKYEDFLAFNTSTGTVPLTTTFMDRNLGATESKLTGTKNADDKVFGLYYQWGRKDPMPLMLSLDNSMKIYLGNTINGTQKFNKTIDNIWSYEQNYVNTSWENNFIDVLNKSIKNPITYLHRDVEESWLPGIYPKLWGHADKKSPFDPCPAGWRVPDASYGREKGSPWFKEGMGKDVYTYKIDSVDADGKVTKFHYEWIFTPNKEIYSIKGLGGELINYPSINGYSGVQFLESIYNLGIIPFAGLKGNIQNQPNFINGFSEMATIWTASMYSHVGGDQNAQALAVKIEGVNDYIEVGEIIRPRSLASVRCAKDETRFTAESIENSPEYIVPINRNLRSEAVEINTNSKLTESQVQVTPNPNSGIFKAMLTDIPEGMLRVFSFTGDEVYTKSFKAESEISINIQSLPAGVYVVQVQSQGQTVSKKIMKK
ncbi:T9SS type A sorting domain-containing protein [Apibacter muscae]|uniref:leucine-rich repeat domain-containing protein n=1 Tax=Apibacter muscae TaxID=2509004 RepID=UPI0011AC3B13|nr:leucine-rich repeat domain-containing protein [Apibacter muscae]TWP24322.1 T9SS type A sorting domain-containing protein [Apibacter muscae]